MKVPERKIRYCVFLSLAVLSLLVLHACAPSQSSSSETVEPTMLLFPGSLSTVEGVRRPIASYGADGHPGPVSTGWPTLPPATAQAIATADAVTATEVAIARATASSVQETQEAVERSTRFVEQTTTSIALVREIATHEAEATKALAATRTAFASQTGPGAVVVPPGEWGGVGIDVEVLTDTVRVKLRCDSAATYVPLTLNASGAFNLPGIYSWCPASCFGNMPAQVQGQVTGSQLNITLLWSYEGQLNTTGPFTATLGQPPDWGRGIGRGMGCPVCLAGDTLVDTPNGLVPAKELHEGMVVWTARSEASISSAPGAPLVRERATVLKTSRTKVPTGHQMVHLVLDDGRELLTSPGHPMADGQPLGTISSGDLIDGAKVVNAELVPYEEDYTYDILPTGGTGTYWANGILVGSTLSGPATDP